MKKSALLTIIIIFFSFCFSCKKKHIPPSSDIISVEGAIKTDSLDNPLDSVRVLLFKSEFPAPAYPVKETFSDKNGNFKIYFEVKHEDYTSYSLGFEKANYNYCCSSLNVEKNKVQHVSVKMKGQ